MKSLERRMAIQERYAYHSFPRGAGQSQDEHDRKGLKVLASIVKHGLLITPEITEWTEPLADGTRSETALLAQKRVCFTDLAPNELCEHASIFGQFALEYSFEVLRELGAFPAFYIPLDSPDSKGLEGAGSTLVMRLGEIQRIFERLLELESLIKITSPHELLDVTRNGVFVGTTRCTIGGAQDLLNILFYQNQPCEDLLSTVRALVCLFYSTNSRRYEGTLRYYRQREWKIISNFLTHKHIKTKEPCGRVAEEICDIDPDFFHRVRLFPTGEYETIQQSVLLVSYRGKRIVRYARRLVVPDHQIPNAQRILDSAKVKLPIVGLSRVASC